MRPARLIEIGGVALCNDAPLALIAGPCSLDGEDAALRLADRLAEIGARHRIGIIYKASFDKANRTRGDAHRGPGLYEGLAILARIKAQTALPILTDIHESAHAEPAAQVADVLQIPAFLCRQTDLLIAAARTGRAVNVKKGQFLAPGDIEHVAHKLVSAGCARMSFTERGTSFGHHDLVVDFRGLEIMKSFGWPIVFDATHSAQQPSSMQGVSGGDRAMIAPLSRAAVAIGVAALYVEIHEEPRIAKSDAAIATTPGELERIIVDALAIDALRKRT